MLPRAWPPFGPPPRSASCAVGEDRVPARPEVDVEPGRGRPRGRRCPCRRRPRSWRRCGWRPGSIADRAVDQRPPRSRRPAVDGVAGVRREVGAVDLLQRRDVEHHEALRRAPGLEAVAGRRRAHVGAVGHHRELERVPGPRQRPEAPALVRRASARARGRARAGSSRGRSCRPAAPAPTRRARRRRRCRLPGSVGIGGRRVGGVREPDVARRRCRRRRSCTASPVKPSTAKPARRLRRRRRAPRARAASCAALSRAKPSCCAERPSPSKSLT